jgi:hypothetical protein
MILPQQLSFDAVNIDDFLGNGPSLLKVFLNK